MIEWNYIVIGLSVLLLFFLLSQEVNRKNKARLTLRILATVMAVISLACMALPINYQSKNQSIASNEAILLTDGFSRDSINKFTSISDPVSVFTTDAHLKDAEKYNASFLPDIGLLKQHHKNVRTLHVFGNGLKKDQLNELRDVRVIFHPSELPTGISDISWQREMKTGDQLNVQGTVHNASGSKLKIVLSSFNTTLDSVVTAGKDESFELSTIPKNAERTVYTIAVIAGNDTLEKEFLPVTIKQGEPIKVLILASSPDFENKFLQSFLSQSGYNVTTRTVISKNKFARVFLNAPTLPLDHITPSLLDKFDVTIADAGELAAISKSELATIQNQVAQRGMGLIIKADSARNAGFYAAKFPLSGLVLTDQQKLNLYLLDSTANLPAITHSNALFIRNVSGTQPLVLNKQNQVFANSTLYGSGKILITTLTNTFNWSLAGEQKAYETFWSTLLSKVAPIHAADETWSVSPELPQTNEATQLQLETNKGIILQGQVNGALVYLKQHDELPYKWYGRYYPAKAGWQSTIQLNGQLFYWYAYDKENWKTLRARKTIEATKIYMNENNHVNNPLEKEVLQTKSEVPKVIFMVLFLLFAGFLWFENKI